MIENRGSKMSLWARRPFSVIASTPASFPGIQLVRAAGRAGYLGAIALENSAPHEWTGLVETLCRFDTQFTVSVQDISPALLQILDSFPNCRLSEVILCGPLSSRLEANVKALHERKLKALVEVASLEQAQRAESARADSLIVKGNESGGPVGSETTLILLQKIIPKISIPVLAKGGIGLRTAAACFVAGAIGVVLDWQLALCEESELPQSLKSRVESMDGSETELVRSNSGPLYRVYAQSMERALERAKARTIERHEQPPSGTDGRSIEERIGSKDLVSIGQDAAFALPLSRNFRTVGRICDEITYEAVRQSRVAARLDAMRAGAPLATAHGTKYPIVQGPMTRVSDRADFAVAVAEAGALPILALALMPGKDVSRLILETKQKLGDKPWGIGILGFVPPKIREEQLAAAMDCNPPFAVIAGGRPDQASRLEKQGTRTYLHVPSPELLRSFLAAGTRHFIFEGRESGGHVGPRSSFILWEQMVSVLLDRLRKNQPGTVTEDDKYHVLFAGGIHDAMSAAMVSAVAAPLSERGVRVGVLLGTAYLFTKEAISTGAIVEGYQRVAIECAQTALLESSPGHITQCADTPFARYFEQHKTQCLQEGQSKELIRETLEELNLGRLRIAAKGIARMDESGPGGTHRYVQVDSQHQYESGMYMLGQLAALRTDVCNMEQLHMDVSRGNEVVQKCIQAFAPLPSTAGSEVAIIGLSCAFPKAKDVISFWQNILGKVNSIERIPEKCIDMGLYSEKSGRIRDRISSQWGGFLGAITFDPLRYGIPPASMESIEPSQMVTLQMVAEALADAGYTERVFDREETSVVVGISGTGDLANAYYFRSLIPRYLKEAGVSASQAEKVTERLDKVLPEWTEDTFPGVLLNVTAGRVANRFDLGGPNLVVDAACGSSLAAIRLGMDELQSGDLAIVVGVDLTQTPFSYLAFSNTHALSPSGQCRPFDESANGTVISEGIAVAVLKPLQDAIHDGDRVYAVLKSVGASSDGRYKGLTAPRQEGQTRALARAYQRAGCDIGSVGLIEAHGTGTPVGDLTEIQALTSHTRATGKEVQPIALGSVKSMIGHTKATAGLAGLVKAALSLYHKVLPPTMGIDKPNTKANFAAGPFYLNTETRPWIRRADGVPRRAGVSAFGFGGTNFHAVLEEYVPAEKTGVRFREAPVRDWPAELFLWRGATREEVFRDAELLRKVFAQHPEPLLCDLAAAVYWKYGRQQGDSCLAIVAGSIKELISMIDAARRLGETASEFEDPRGIYFASRPANERGKIAFLFPGQGSQYVDMLKHIALAFPHVRQSLEKADGCLQTQFEKPLSRFIYPPPSPEHRERQELALQQTRVAQPALAACDMAMCELLGTLGVDPDMAGGHSYGELAALCCAGALAFDDLVVLSEARGRFMEDCARSQPGVMAAVDTGRETITELVKELEGVFIANLNTDRQTVISGARPNIQQALNLMSEKGISGRILPVSCAFHSPLVAAAQQPFRQFLNQCELRVPRIQVFSNTNAVPYDGDPEMSRDLLEMQLVRPVRFAEQVKAMHECGARVFVEVGPGKVLTALVKQILRKRSFVAINMDDPSRHGIVQLCHVAARLATAGVRFLAGPLFEGRVSRVLNLEELAGKTADQPATNAWTIQFGQAVPPPEFKPKATRLSTRSQDYRPVHSPHDDSPTNLRLDKEETVHSDTYLMRSHEQLMNAFLRTHRDVMQAYLQYRGAGQAEGDEMDVSAFQERDLSLDELAGAGEPQRPPKTTTPEDHDKMPRHVESATTARNAITDRLLELVAGRTGYPREMLNLDLDLEADLGVDSIKRIEILASLTDSLRLPAGWYEALEFSKIRTLRSIAEYIARRMNGDGGGDPIGQKPHSLPEDHEIMQRLLEIVSGRTGYPLEMLDVDQDLEGELGIDSIKRVEILGALQESLHLSGTLELQALTQLKTVRETARLIRAQSTTQSMEPAPTHRKAEHPGNSSIARLVVRCINAPVPEPALLERNAFVLITDDGGGIALALAKELGERGIRSEIVSSALPLRHSQDRVQTLVHLAPLSNEQEAEDWDSRLERELTGLLQLARELEMDLRKGGSILAATRMGGAFALQADLKSNFWPGSGGVAGLVKTLALEWPEVKCRTVDFGSDASNEQIAAVLLQELAYRDELVEVGYCGQTRKMIVSVPAELEPGAAKLDLNSSSVILLTGGGRGITAETAIELAQQYQPKLVLVGRTPLASEQREIGGANGDCKRTIATAALADETNAASGRLAAERNRLKCREIESNIAHMRAAGSYVEYHSLDITDRAAFKGLIESIYERFGQIDGVIHGAGVIADKLVRDKSIDSFARVVKTKVGPAWTLGKCLQLEKLKFLAFYSSVAARSGNPGQADYAAANEVLNKTADLWNAQWPARVVSINWGPWDSNQGMVSPELQERLLRRGVSLISAAAGRRALVQELRYGGRHEPEVIWGSTLSPVQGANSPACWPLLDPNARNNQPSGRDSFELSLEVHPTEHRYLADHKIGDALVMPMAMITELAAEAAARHWQGMQVTAVRNLSVFRGISFNHDHPIVLEVKGSESRRGSDQTVTVDLTVGSGLKGSTQPNYAVTVELQPSRELPAEAVKFELTNPAAFPLPVTEAYRQWLFHGPLFAGILEVSAIGENGIAGRLRPSSPAELLTHGAGREWIIDPVTLDSAGQLAGLWARHYLGQSLLPSRFGLLRCYSPIPEKGVRCQVRIDRRRGGPFLDVEFWCLDEAGQVVTWMQDLEVVCSTELNAKWSRTLASAAGTGNGR